MSFSKDFFWGAATASYQIEGAATADGKGPSVWDMLCRKPGAVQFGNTGDTACDHYHRYKEDVDIMKALGLQAYRFSISWPRVLPEGTGRINESGLDFYDRLVDELLEKNITPYITLFHWDYPYALYKKGGWLNSDSSNWFADYTRVIVDRLSDRVSHWITQNEPQCYIVVGHYVGKHAPGLKLDVPEVLLAGHNSLLAHGKSVQVIRSHSKQPCEIGYAPVGAVSIPASDSPEDIAAVKKAMFGYFGSDMTRNIRSNSWWMDPVYLGHYPEDGVRFLEKYLPQNAAEEIRGIYQPIDFFGINIYHGATVKMGSDGNPEIVEREAGFPRTAMDWPITPKALYWGPKMFHERYKKPVVITENGLSNTDWVNLDGKVHDPQRIDFLSRYIREFMRSAEHGVEAKGYFQWSLMDNFEWADGYHERFGLVHVDYATQKRTIKDSGNWYKKVIESNGEMLK